MNFVTPLFLIALTALAVPIIIHLFNFRRYRKIYFTNVRFIAEIKQESKKRSQLKHLLILLMRLLAIACLVLAFAQPYIPSALTHKRLSGKQAVSIYVDNSFSMEAVSPGGRLLDVAKGKAREIADACNPSDLFQLLTNDFEGRHQRFVNRDEFRTMLDEVQISPSVRPLPEVIKRQNSLLLETSGKNRSAYLVSDFQKSTSGILNLKSDTSVTYFFVPVVAGRVNNLYIDTAWFDSPVQQPNQPVKLKVRIRNSSDEQLEKIPIKLYINKTQKAVASFSIAPGGETVIILPYTNNEAGIQYGSLEITDYPVTWDDKFYFSYGISSAIPILCINGSTENPFLNTLFINDTAFRFSNAMQKQLDYSSFPHYPLIILNGLDEISSGLALELTRYCNDGGNIVIFPSAKIDVDNYRSFLSPAGIPYFLAMDTARQKITEVNTESELYTDVFEKDASGRIQLPENVDMPVVFKHYTLYRTTRSGEEDLLKMQNGQPFLLFSKSGKGKVYLFASPLDDRFSNFPKHPVFVPTLYKIALLSQPFTPLYYTIDADNSITVSGDSLGGKEVYKIRKLDSDYEFIPELRTLGQEVMLYPHNQVKEAGQYYVTADKAMLRGLAFNYNRIESDMACIPPAELERQLKQARVKYFAVFSGKKTPLTKEIHEINQGTPLWKLFILLTLIFIAGEILLIRLLKD
jgi:hypothetical protein